MIDPVMAPLAAILITIVTLAGMLRMERLPLDHPNARSLHARPIPRVGGIAVMAGVGIGTAVSIGLAPVLLIAIALAVISFIDDVRGLPILVRLAFHAAAAAAALALMSPALSWTMLAVWFLGMIWMTNLYNFMDGSDGLAGGMAVAGFGAYGLAAWMGGDQELGFLFLAVASAALGFLLFNFPPARVFLGDAGSVPLGFLAGAGGMAGWERGLWPLWFPVLVFSPFAVDATVTLIKRLLRRERVWEAHRDHYYQRLVRLGWGHRGTALAEYGLMLACAGVAVIAIEASLIMQIVLLLAASSAYLAAMVAIDRAWRHKQVSLHA
jgi:UDP-GlcNAc:undecaprenyl-phosphate GlcNAc-1-phosphate transferase